MNRIRLNAIQTLALGFALLILTGAVLLSLPLASRQGSLPFVDALFTSASASCVTGLVIYDTFTQFSWFGQLVLMLLIQIGGLGFMMVSILVSILLGRRIGLHERSILMESVGALKIGGVVRLSRRALIVTGVCEGTGALVMSYWFCPQFGLKQGLWMSLFHAVSAFCNAGFDLMGIRAPGTSFTTASDVWVVNLTLMILIIIGGLGFLVWDDIITKKLRYAKYRLHTKIVLVTTAALLVLGTGAFFLIEGDHAFAGLPMGQKALMSMFQSVSPRTAGFNTVDLNSLSDGGTLLTIILMFIGAGSGSTGGGIKVNTFAVLILGVWSYARRRDTINVFHRRLDEETVQKAYSSVSQYFITCMIGCMVLCLQGFQLDDALFEAFSAIGTVGLTRGITPLLPLASKLVVTLLMFSGRVGSLSVAMAMTSPKPQLRNPAEKILIG